MRKFINLLLIVALVTVYLPASIALAEPIKDTGPIKDTEQAEQLDPLNLQVRSAVLIDVETGQILYTKNENIPLPPASVTKVMTMLIIMEAIEKGHVAWEDVVTTSTKAHKMTGSVVFLADGEKATLRQMFEAVAVYSANDAAVAIAEHVGGSEESFVNLMNEKARELGLSNTRFLNVTGLPYLEQYPNFNDPDGHIMSAFDIALISAELVKKYPKVLEFTSTTFATFQNGVDMPTRNNIILRNDWIDGLKTGFTNEAKYCLSATGQKDGMRLVSVILGAENDRVRQDETLKILNYGFSNFKKQTMVRGKDEIKVVKVDKGKEREVTLLAAQNLDLVIEKEASDDAYTQVIEIQESVVAPIEANTVLGKLYYEKDGVLIGEPIDLVAKEAVEKGGFFRLLVRGIKDTFFGVFDGIADKLLGMFTKEDVE